MGFIGILLALGLLIWLAYRGWSVLLLAPAAAILAAGLSGEPLLAHWTQTFMGSAARFIMQFFPIFLLGALFGKLMEGPCVDRKEATGEDLRRHSRHHRGRRRDQIYRTYYDFRLAPSGASTVRTTSLSYRQSGNGSISRYFCRSLRRTS